MGAGDILRLDFTKEYLAKRVSVPLLGGGGGVHACVTLVCRALSTLGQAVELIQVCLKLFNLLNSGHK